MHRRSFLAGGAALFMTGIAESQAKNAIIELRQFKLRNTVDNMSGRTNDFLAKSALPAMRRAGAGPAGCFGSLIAQDSPFVLIVSAYPTIQAWESAAATIAADKQYQKERDAYAAGGLGYVRMEVSLLRGFDTAPTIEVPPPNEKKTSRIFELRVYESNNLGTLRRKIRMFNEGEIGLFRKLDMRPVFFGETIVGRNMPNLTYMLVFESLAAREKAWSTFASHPEWTKLKSQPGVSDAEIVSNISNSILRPLPFSDIK